MTIRTPGEVRRFWLDEVGEKGWYAGGQSLDDRVRDGFEATWMAAVEARLAPWMATPEDALAWIVLLDQFPRNMFRGESLSFASDPHARRAATTAIGRGWDLRVEPPARQFFYLPLEHSERLVDQDRAVRLFVARMPEPDLLLHARAHRQTIRDFGRFPARNAALGRDSRPEEKEWLAAGGYAALLDRMRAA